MKAGYRCSTKGGVLDVHDLCRLQGFDSHDIDYLGAGVTDLQLGQCVGNMMSVNVLMALMPHVLFHSKLISVQEFRELKLRSVP